MLIKKQILSLILFCLLSIFYSQKIENIDSIYHQIIQLPNTPEKIEKLIELNKKAHYNRPDLVEKALEIATDIYYINGIARAYDTKGYMARKKNDFIKSVEYHKRALGFLEQSNDTLLKIRCLNNLGVSLRKLNDDKEAYNYYLIALDLAKIQKDNKQIARILNGIGNVFVNTEEYDKALYYFKKSLSYELKSKNLKGQEYNFANIGEIFIYKKQYDSAETYLQKSLNLAKILYSPNKVGVEYNLLGLLYKEKGDFIQSIIYYNKALPMLKNQNIKRYTANSYINKGLAELALKKYEVAYKDILKGLTIAKKIKSKENISLGYNALVKYYELTNHYKEALKAHKTAKKFHDSIVNITTKNSIITNQIIYETREKDNKIKQLAFEKEYAKKVSKRNFWIMIIIGISSLITVIFIYMFFSLRKKNKELELEQKNSEIQSYLLKIKELEQKMEKKQKSMEIDLSDKLQNFDLTKREIDVVKLIADGYSNEEIAKKMFISKNTVKSHIKNIYLKLDVKNRIQVIKKLH